MQTVESQFGEREPVCGPATENRLHNAMLALRGSKPFRRLRTALLGPKT